MHRAPSPSPPSRPGWSRDLLRDFSGWPAGPLHLAIGVFDGVHVGHRALIARLADGARAERATPLAATFDPLPITVLAPGAPASALSEVGERAHLLERAGAEMVIAFTFDTLFAGIAADEFVARVARAGDVKRIVVGPDFHFGRRAEGDVERLRELGGKHGFGVEVVVPIEREGRPVSSTRIRNALLAGDLETTTALLGRPYSVRGLVVHGARRGRGLGFPTINLSLPHGRLLPRDGIYAMYVAVAGARHKAAASLGVRPTFGAGERWLEAHLLDFEGDLYGESAEAAFVRRLRDELAFESPEALAAQIARDVDETRNVLGS